MLECPACQSECVELKDEIAPENYMGVTTARAICEECEATWVQEYTVEFHSTNTWELERSLIPRGGSYDDL